MTQELPAVQEKAAEPPPPAPRVRRFWSRRRVPAAITAVLVLAVAGPLLYDVAAVRAGRDAFAWRERLAEELATRPLDDPWIIAGAAVAAVLGLWLIVLALTPGLRAVLPMRADKPTLRAGLDRHAAELALRDRAMEVPGVRTARAGVSRRRAVVHAEVHFRETEEVRGDLRAALDEAMAQLGLARPLPLVVRIRRMGSGSMKGSRINRLLLGLIGVVLLGTGLLVLVAALDLPRHWGFTMPEDWPYTTPDDVLLSDSARARYRDEEWWWPAVIAVLALIVLIALWWLLAQLRGHRLRQTRVVDGALLRGRALEDVVAADAERLPGVSRAHVQLTGDPDTPATRTVLALTPHARPRAVLTDLDTTALANAARSLGRPDLPTEVRMRAVSHRASRVT